MAEAAGKQYWVAAERVGWFQAMHRVVTGLCPVPAGQSPATTQALSFDDAVLIAVQGWMPHLGPTTASEIGELLGLPASEIEKALLRMEASGAILRGKFRPADSRPASFRFTRTRDRVVRAPSAGAHSSPDGCDAAQANCARHGIAVHELAIALAARRSRHAGAGRARNARSDPPVAGI